MERCGAKLVTNESIDTLNLENIYTDQDNLLLLLVALPDVSRQRKPTR